MKPKDRSGDTSRPDEGIGFPTANPLVTEWVNSAEGIFWVPAKDGKIYRQWFNIYESEPFFDSESEFFEAKRYFFTGDTGIRWAILNIERNRFVTEPSRSGAVFHSPRQARKVRDNLAEDTSHLKIVRVSIHE